MHSIEKTLARACSDAQYVVLGLGMAGHRVPRASAISLVERLSERAAGWLASIQPATVTLSRGRVLSTLHYLCFYFLFIFAFVLVRVDKCLFILLHSVRS